MRAVNNNNTFSLNLRTCDVSELSPNEKFQITNGVGMLSVGISSLLKFRCFTG